MDTSSIDKQIKDIEEEIFNTQKNKATEHHAPDGEFFSKLVRFGGPIHKATGDFCGEKTRHSNSIQGKMLGW